jgi:hypothetical protein
VSRVDFSMLPRTLDRRVASRAGTCGGWSSKTDPRNDTALLRKRAGERGVISVDMLAKIRRMHLRDGVSIREVCRRTGLSRNTVQHWLRQEGVTEPKYPKRASGSAVDAFGEHLEAALRAATQPLILARTGPAWGSRAPRGVFADRRSARCPPAGPRRATDSRGIAAREQHRAHDDLVQHQAHRLIGRCDAEDYARPVPAGRHSLIECPLDTAHRRFASFSTKV